MTDPQEIAKWREAHPGIYVPEAGLASVAPFPSLYATDFAVYLEAKGTEPQVVSFVRETTREIAWAYGNWQKAQHDADPARLVEDMLNNATSVGGDAGHADYGQVRKFLTDYARANGIALSSDISDRPAWMDALSETGVKQSTGIASVGERPIFPAALPVTSSPAVISPPADDPRGIAAALADDHHVELTGADHADR